MKRDKKLGWAVTLFSASAMAALVQIWITSEFIYSAVMGQWEQFSEFFGVEAPASGPDVFCFDYCAPEMPFLAGWLGIASFLLGFVLLVTSWWKSRT